MSGFAENECVIFIAKLLGKSINRNMRLSLAKSSGLINDTHWDTPRDLKQRKTAALDNFEQRNLENLDMFGFIGDSWQHVIRVGPNTFKL